MTFDASPRDAGDAARDPQGRPSGKMRGTVRDILNLFPSPRMFWPDVNGLEAALLWAALAVLPFQHRLVQLLGLQSRTLRRFRRRTLAPGPLKVLHVTCSFDVGGTQRQIINLCERQDRGAFLHDTIEIFPEQNYLYRQDVVLQPDRYTGQTAIGRMLARLTLHMNTRSVQAVQVYKLARDFRALRPDIVVGWGHEMSMLAFLAAARERVPHIVFCIRTFNPDFGWTTRATGTLLKVSHTRMQPYLSGIITNSTRLRDDYATWLGIAASEIRVCPNGVDLLPATHDSAGRREAVRRRFDIPSDALVVCNVGRFSREKGQMLLLRANEHLAARYGERAPIWLLCGDGPLLPEVQRDVEARGMRNVRFTGRVDDVDGCLSAADIFVMPSDFEGMPNAMMEAMAHGLPCISTDCTGALDVARDGVEALYCPAGSSDAIATHVSTLIENPAERTRLGANARERIKAFSVERVTRAFDTCLEAMATRTSPAAMVRQAHPPRSYAVAERGTGGPNE